MSEKKLADVVRVWQSDLTSIELAAEQRKQRWIELAPELHQQLLDAARAENPSSI